MGKLIYNRSLFVSDPRASYMPQRVLIIIPTYNEALTIQSTIEAIRRETTPFSSSYSLDILIFDSASTDNTVDIVHAVQKTDHRLHLAEEPIKSGLGSAYIQAMQYALTHLSPDMIFEYDADGSHDPTYLNPMIERIQKGADVVVGSRYVTGGGVPDDWGWHRKLLSKWGNIIAQTLLIRRYKDYTSGFRVTKASFLKKINLESLLSKDYGYKLHLFWALHQQGANIEEHPIVFKDREQGVSKLPSNSIIDSLQVLFTLRYRRHALYIKTCLVGLVGYILQFTVFNTLFFFLPALLSTLISIECAIALNFYNNNRFTFKKNPLKFTKKKHLLKKFLSFNALSFGSIIAQMSFVGISHHLLNGNRAEVNLALFTGVLLGSVINYLAYRHWIWQTNS